MTQQELQERAQKEIKRVNSFYIKLKKFDKGELHPTIAASYNTERVILLNRLNNIEDVAKKQFGIKIQGLYNAKERLWSALASIKYRMSEL